MSTSPPRNGMPASSRGRVSGRSWPTTSRARRHPSTTPIWISRPLRLAGLGRLWVLREIGVELRQVLLRELSGEAVGGEVLDVVPIGAGAIKVALDRAQRAALEIGVGELRLQRDR